MSTKRSSRQENTVLDMELDFEKLLMLNGSSHRPNLSIDDIAAMTKVGTKPDIKTDL